MHPDQRVDSLALENVCTAVGDGTGTRTACVGKLWGRGTGVLCSLMARGTSSVWEVREKGHGLVNKSQSAKAEACLHCGSCFLLAMEPVMFTDLLRIQSADGLQKLL